MENPYAVEELADEHSRQIHERTICVAWHLGVSVEVPDLDGEADGIT